MSAPHDLTGGDRIPLAYLITFRAYGTWLHGDERGSTDRHHNQYKTPFILHNERWKQYNIHALRREPVELDATRRDAVEAAIRETCEVRGWFLRAINVRTNHIHVVISAQRKPDPILSTLKANATRRMKQMGCWAHEHSPWSQGGSRRYLWTERSVVRAVDYVVYGQGDQVPSFDGKHPAS